MVCIWVTGRKPTARRLAERPIRAFRATGLRVIFALLCAPGAPGASYRDIAAMSEVSLGAVAQTFTDLARLGYVRKSRTGWKFEQRAKLIDAWVEAYPRELRPRLQPCRYQVKAKPDWWKTEDLSVIKMWLGGEGGAALLTRHLRPQLITLYGKTQYAELAQKIRPVRDDGGNLDVLETFWGFEPSQPLQGYQIAPPLLVYADLVATADARNLETAEIVRERFLD